VSGGLDSLSRREDEVFRLLVLGYLNPEIAARLGLSVRTVESHRASMQRKLGLTSRAQLVELALRHGLLGGPPH
jgi:two-component system response regulator NreC